MCRNFIVIHDNFIVIEINNSHKISESLCNALKALRDDNLISADKGDYKLNPEIFWKGDQRIRKEELLKNKELKITYELVDAE